MNSPKWLSKQDNLGKLGITKGQILIFVVHHISSEISVLNFVCCFCLVKQLVKINYNNNDNNNSYDNNI